MSLPRTFVGFSSTDILSYWLMLAWKDHEDIDFDFCDCQLEDEIDSRNEAYIKRRCRERIQMAGTYILLIGEDTRWKDQYVLWEAEIAIEKHCRLIGVNMDSWTRMNPDTCPSVFRDVGAVFVPFSPHIVGYAIEDWQRRDPQRDDWFYKESVYDNLGYGLTDNTAFYIPKPKPWER